MFGVFPALHMTLSTNTWPLYQLTHFQTFLLISSLVHTNVKGNVYNMAKINGWFAVSRNQK